MSNFTKSFIIITYNWKKYWSHTSFQQVDIQLGGYY